MDILNFISWIASKRRVVTSAPDDALVPIGIRTETRDDKYTTVAIKKSDLITTPEPAYKVYTSLLTQSGGDNYQSISSGSLTIGVTYQIISASGAPGDFINVGAPNNNLGTYFVATGTDPNEWGAYELEYNTGAPVATVLENTIGNVWFNYFGIGQYQIFSDNLFTLDKSWATAYSGGDDEVSFNGFVVSPNGNNELRLNSGNGNNDHISIRLEIRVYN
jgi:hypothetical protein